MCAYSLDHITPSRLRIIRCTNTTSHFKYLGDQVPRLSLYDTSWTFCLKTLATSQFSKNATWPQRRVASNLCVCAQNHSELPGSVGLVGLGGLEPPASPLSGVRSNHLSYRPKSQALQDYNMVELVGIEPTTPCLQSRCSPS